MKCGCGAQPVALTQKDPISYGGLFGAVIFLVGLPLLAVGIVPGLVVMAIGVIVGSAARSTTTYLICPVCKKKEPVT